MGEFGAVAVVSGKIRGQTATMPITIEMLDVNLTEYKDLDFARVRFFPNGPWIACGRPYSAELLAKTGRCHVRFHPFSYHTDPRRR